jgi:maltose alpha-D-glucosyltransferase/alpha-amylase
MRLNKGIRRRLAPLLGNDLDRLTLAHALLLSLPGSPILYYGDEIGMGDNVLLKDRDGVRTPMQWTAGPNAGFSTAPAADLVLPVIDDEHYGAAAVNVEAQEASGDSLLARVRSLVRVRRQHHAFGRGSIGILPCDNSRVLVFERTGGADTIVVVANLARSTQAAAIEFPAAVGGFHLIDVIDREMLAPLGAGPYAMTLAPQACRWLRLVASPAPADVDASSTIAGEVITAGEAVRAAPSPRRAPPPSASVRDPAPTPVSEVPAPGSRSDAPGSTSPG